MRESSIDKGWIEENGHTIGLYLGRDFCAEHEGRIDGLEAVFGIEGEKFGLKNRQIEQFPAGHWHFEEYEREPRDKRRKPQRCALLVVTARGLWPEFVENARTAAPFWRNPGDPGHTPESDLACAWDERSFVVNVRGAENIARLRTLLEAFTQLDIAFGIRRTGWLPKGGLVLMVASTIPAEEIAALEARDQARIDLHRAWTESGIEARLRAAGKRWYALSPEWKDRTAGELQAFLNPSDQRSHHAGRFTVAELDAWARNEGPVLKR